MVFDPLSVKGEWWFPKSDLKFEGHLTFDAENGGILTIFGSMEPFMMLDIATEQLSNSDSR